MRRSGVRLFSPAPVRMGVSRLRAANPLADPSSAVRSSHSLGIFRTSDYTIRFAARNEGLRYEDASGVYRFDLGREGKMWLVQLPPSKGEQYVPVALTESKASTILPRIEAFLSRVRWLGVWPVRYQVSFVEQGATPNPSFQRTPYGGR